MRPLNKVIWLALISFVIVGFGSAVEAQPPDFEFFEETGKYVRGEFWAFYQQFDDALTVFGYPITDEVIDPETGRTVQYFQKARFDLVNDPENPIQLFNLGARLYTPEGGTDLLQVINSSSCRPFPTGFSVCMGFLSFYDSHNGSLVLGNPISNAELRDGLYVQYFENARLEFRLLLPPGQKIGLSDLGKIYFDKYIRAASPTGTGIILNPNTEKLCALTYVDSPLLPQNSSQVLNVIVLDQHQLPVVGADIEATLKLGENGRKITIDLPPSNENGISQAHFDIGDPPPPVMEVVEVEVIVRYENALETKARTWFRLWW